MKAKQIVSLLMTGTLSTILLFGALVLSGCHHRTPEEKADRFIERIADRLELDAEQKRHLTGLRTELMDRREKMKSGREAFRTELIAQVKSDTFDSSRLDAMIDDKLAAAEEIAAIVTRRLADFHATLRPEQKAELVEMIEDVAACHDRFHHGC